MHDDPTIHLWMLQNALTTFTQIVHRTVHLFFYKNYCQGVIFVYSLNLCRQRWSDYFQLATTVSPQTRR